MRSSTVWILATLALAPAPALAYIDPASGSALLSAIVSGIVAGGMAVRAYWSRIKEYFRGRREGGGSADDRESGNP